MRFVTIAKTLDQLRSQKLTPRGLRMAEAELKAFREDYMKAADVLSGHSLASFARTFKGIWTGKHFADSGMCIIEGETQNVLMILLEKK